MTRRVRARFRTASNDQTVDVMILDSGEASRTIAGTSYGDVVFVPFGIERLWEINSDLSPAAGRRRKTRVPRAQQYLLVVPRTRPETIAFEYKITGRNAAGRTRTITGTFERNDDPPFAPCSYTIVHTRPLTDISIGITELPGEARIQPVRPSATAQPSLRKQPLAEVRTHSAAQR